MSEVRKVKFTVTGGEAFSEDIIVTEPFVQQCDAVLQQRFAKSAANFVVIWAGKELNGEDPQLSMLDLGMGHDAQVFLVPRST